MPEETPWRNRVAKIVGVLALAGAGWFGFQALRGKPKPPPRPVSALAAPKAASSNRSVPEAVKGPAGRGAPESKHQGAKLPGQSGRGRDDGLRPRKHRGAARKIPSPDRMRIARRARTRSPKPSAR